MKVGILTFHSAHNYGAVLQAYALQETIKGLSFETDIIDYRPDYLMKLAFFPITKSMPLPIRMKLLLEGLVCLYGRSKRRRGFAKFIQSKLRLSAKNFKRSFSSNGLYDAYVMGSDQIWNICLTKGFDNVYWGDFTTKEKAVKISYAASMSYYLLSQQQKQRMSDLLKNFHSISVREEETQDYIQENFKTDATTVLDPTLLLDRSNWKMISKKPRTLRKYVLVYAIGLRNEAFIIAKSIAHQLNANIIELTMNVDKNLVVNRYQTASPEDFLGLFENAECVVTSSFHGTTFSIIYNKPFYSLSHGNDKDSRQKTLLRKLGLLDRFISSNSTPSFQQILYDDANANLEILRNESIAFLKNNLNDIK